MDLNATIASAVNARIEAEVFAALAGDDVIKQYVAAALNAPVKVERNYRTEEVKWLPHTIRTVMQDATRDAVKRVIAEEAPLIEDEVRRAIKRQASGLAEAFTGALVKQASKSYGLTVSLKLPGERD